MVEARLTAPSATPAPALRWTPNRVRLVTVIAVAVLWEAMSRSGLFYRDVVPSIFAVASAVYAEVASAAFYHHLWITFAAVAVGFVVGALLAVGVQQIGEVNWTSKIFGFIALVFASVNIFGGFLVTQRMLAMYKKKG